MKEKIDKAIEYIKEVGEFSESGDLTVDDVIDDLLEILGDEEMDKFEEMKKFEILDKNVPKEDINWLYSGEEYIITKEDIEALLKGNKLYGQINHEYAFTIELGDKENE